MLARVGGAVARVNVAHRPEELEPARRAVAIGTFDGVHLGHRRVIEAALAAGLRPTVVTFDPHPRDDPRQPRRAARDARAAARAARASSGVEDVLVVRVRRRARRRSRRRSSPESILRATGAEVVAAGDDFRFGRGRAGDLELLERLGFDVRRVPLVDGVSSSHIRALLAAGDVAQAAAAARPPGRGRGDGRRSATSAAARSASRRRTSPSPPDLLVPALGIYAGAALGHRAAISIGTNPHYGGTERRVEAYLLDFEGDLYGQRLVVELWERLRDEAAFEIEAGARSTAIADDVAHARRGRPARDPSRSGASFPAGSASSFGMETALAARVARAARERPLPRVRRGLLEAGRGRDGPRRTPAAPMCGYVGLDPGQPAGRRRERRAAPPRVGRAPGPPDRADAAEVVVPLPASAGRCGRPPRAARAPSSSTPGSALTTSPAGWTRGRSTASCGSRPSSRIAGGDARRARCAAACRRRAPIASTSPSRVERERSAPSCSASARPARAAPTSRSTSPSMLFRCRSRPGRKSPEPRPRLVVSTHAFPSRVDGDEVRRVRLRAARAVERARASASTRSAGERPRSRGSRGERLRHAGEPAAREERACRATPSRPARSSALRTRRGRRASRRPPRSSESASSASAIVPV